jgi:serine/threonine protein kinase
VKLTLRDKDKNNIFALQCLFMSEIISETLREITPRLADDGRYTIVSTVREGRLFLADRAGKRFVLKTARDAKGLEMLKREYELSSRLQHPCIASALLWEDDSPVGPAIVIEYVRGRNLAEYLAEKPSLKARERVFDQILDAVGAIHRQSIIHNDIKPENILITEADDDVKIIDFGFADADSHFLEKSIGGTRLYASPELLASGTTDARSDIYSIGILMKDMFPGRYGRIARKCASEAPDDRFANISELRAAWDGRHRPAGMIAVLLAIVVVLGAAALLYLRSNKAGSPADVATEDRVDTVVIVKVDTVYAVSPAPAAPVSARTHSSARTPSDARIIDSLTNVLKERDRKDAEDKAALEAAKAKVEAVYDRSISKFRKALSKAQTQKEAVAAWMALVEDMKEVNFDIPAATPEPVAHILREYILQRNTVILETLNKEFTARTAELPQN